LSVSGNQGVEKCIEFLSSSCHTILWLSLQKRKSITNSETHRKVCQYMKVNQGDDFVLERTVELVILVTCFVIFTTSVLF
jgi:hypothetical protein